MKRNVTWAVTLDFHNTIARCDEWFELEVYELIPAYFRWRQASTGNSVPDDVIQRGKTRYRELRQEVMESGEELDAASGVEAVLGTLGLPIDVAEVDEALESIFRPTLATTRPIPGILDTVESLSGAGVRLAVISSAAYHEFLVWTLELFGIADRFERILTSASTGHYKSTPRIYHAALELLEIPPERCIHVGDSERFDVCPAARAGMNTVLYSHDDEGPCSASKADLCVESLVDLPARLQSRFGIPVEV